MNRDLSPPLLSKSYRKRSCVFVFACSFLLVLLSFSAQAGIFSTAKFKTVSELRESLGNPISSFIMGSRSILQYETDEFWVEGETIVGSRALNNSATGFPDVPQIIVMDSNTIQPPETLGLLPSKDAYIRGGSFSKFAYGKINQDNLSISGFNGYTPTGVDESVIREIQGRIRKVYLEFDISQQLVFGEGAFSLIVHPSEPWVFSDGGRGVSPTIHVFALAKPSVSGVDSWEEERLNWSTARGNSRMNGADMLHAFRLKSRSFRLNAGDRDQLPRHYEMRFDLGDLSRFIQDDGRITLMVTHSSDSILKLASKESGENDWFCPRLVME